MALIEAGWRLGDRLLVLAAPQLRGDDVTELQDALNQLGFDCGRPDGIFGPPASDPDVPRSSTAVLACERHVERCDRNDPQSGVVCGRFRGLARI